MPTASRLVAALSFAATAYLAATLYTPALPEGTQATWFPATSAIIGALCGWFVGGPLAGKGYRAAFGLGIRTGVTMVFWVAFAFSLRGMILKSLKKRYDGPTEAVLDIPAQMADYAALMLSVEVLGTLVVGSILAGMLTEWAARRWD